MGLGMEGDGLFFGTHFDTLSASSSSSSFFFFLVGYQGWMNMIIMIGVWRDQWDGILCNRGFDMNKSPSVFHFPLSRAGGLRLDVFSALFTCPMLALPALSAGLLPLIRLILKDA